MPNCNIDLFPLPVYDSAWVFANPLPVVFEVESTLFPTNSVDAVFAISSVADANGYAKITITATNSGFVCGEYLRITGSYAGVFQILEAVSLTVFVIDTPYIATATGTAQTYYKDYYVNAKVYAGIPAGQNYASENPLGLIATLQVRPSLDNIARIDVSSALRARFLQIENSVCAQTETGNEYFNDRIAWIAFYIEYAETYQVATACEVSTFASDYVQSQTYFAINGTSQFQYAYGNNAGEFVLNDNNLAMPTKFLTTISEPTMYEGKEFDLAFILPQELCTAGQTVEVKVLSSTGASYTETIDTSLGYGVYRILLGDAPTTLPNSAYFDVTLLINTQLNSEVKRVNVSYECSQYGGKHVTWLNTLGGWDYLFFGAGQNKTYDTEEVQSIERNMFTNWSANFVKATAQTDNIQRKSRKGGTLRTFRLTKDLRDAIAEQLKASVKILEVLELPDAVSCLDVPNRKVLIPSSGSFGFEETDKQYFLSLDYTETNEILSQWQ